MALQDPSLAFPAYASTVRYPTSNDGKLNEARPGGESSGKA